MLKILISFIVCVTVFSCSTKTGSILASKKTERQKYGELIKATGGADNALLQAWAYAGAYALDYPLAVSNNYAEAGNFAPSAGGAAAFITEVNRGMRLSVSLRKKEPGNLKMYIDLWRAGDTLTGRPRSFLIEADTASGIIYFTADRDEKLIIRFQKEIGKSGGYNFTMETGPSLLFPVRGDVKSNIGSLWGDPRDGGARRHEGVDIMAAKGSPLVAVADGVISEVSEDSVGGKIIYLRPKGAAYRVYYAHLDTQLVPEDKEVRAGEIIGTVGNTGNARTTVPHLHFGIYTSAGPIDPLLFIKPVKASARKQLVFPAKTAMTVIKNAAVFNDILRNSYYTILEKNSVVTAEAVNDNYYKVILADGRKGFIAKGDLK